MPFVLASFMRSSLSFTHCTNSSENSVICPFLLFLHPLTPEQKHYKGLVAQYGEENVQKLYEAFDSFKAKISTGDLEYQIKKLKFEANWVEEKNKFPTSPEMVKMLKRAGYS